MSSVVFQVKAWNGKTYNVARASAVDQFTLFTMISGKAAMISASSGENFFDSQSAMFGLMTTFSESDLSKIANLTLGKVVISGTDESVTISDFQNEIFSYISLISQAVKENLSDFFTYLQVINKPKEENQAQ